MILLPALVVTEQSPGREEWIIPIIAQMFEKRHSARLRFWGLQRIFNATNGDQVPDVGLLPYPFALIREMSAHIEKNAPAGEDTKQWQY